MDDYWFDEEYEEGWNWYIVAGYSPKHLTQITEGVPVCAAGFEQAMDIYEILLKLVANK